MPQPRKYIDQAEKQRAYRARLQAEQLQQHAAKAPTYAKWRKALQEAASILQNTETEIDAWMQERSERWQESDRASEMEEDREQLRDLVEAIASLHIWRTSH